MFPRGHPAPGGFSVGCSPWRLSFPQCEVPVGCGSSRLDLPLSNHFQAAVPQWWPCHDVRWPWALRCTIGPPMWTGSSQECISSHVPFHMPFSMFLKFFFLCQLPQAATACSQTCELFKSSLGVMFELLGYQSCLRHHMASSHKVCPAAVCCQSSLVYTRYSCVFFCSVMLKNANLIIKFKTSEFWYTI